MSIDEWLERLTQRHEALTQTVELLTKDLSDMKSLEVVSKPLSTPLESVGCRHRDGVLKQLLRIFQAIQTIRPAFSSFAAAQNPGRSLSMRSVGFSLSFPKVDTGIADRE